jgi:hypothetical protein
MRRFVVFSFSYSSYLPGQEGQKAAANYDEQKQPSGAATHQLPNGGADNRIFILRWGHICLLFKLRKSV